MTLAHWTIISHFTLRFTRALRFLYNSHDPTRYCRSATLPRDVIYPLTATMQSTDRALHLNEQGGVCTGRGAEQQGNGTQNCQCSAGELSTPLA